MNRQQTMLQHVQAYLKHRRALGFELQTAQIQLPLFAKFLGRLGRRGPLTTDLILRWVHLPKNAALSYKAKRLSIVRGFARYMAARDGRTEVPDWRLLPKVSYRRPCLFSERQLQQLLTAAGRLKPSYPLRPLTYRTLFGLLASTGLRISEALKLTRGHVDFDEGILRVEKTKFKKSRLVPLHPTAARALHHYAKARDRQWGQDGRKPFFVGTRGQKLPYRTVLDAFYSLCADLGWNQPKGEELRPRIHSLRHSFVCRRFLRWCRSGENVNQLMAALSTYLGHRRVTDTYWYLTGTPELLAIAGDRFERSLRMAKGGRS